MMNFIRKRILSFYYAFQGLRSFFRSQHNFYIHILACLVTLTFGFWFNITSTEWSLILLCIALVFSVEIINSALEVLVDLVSPTWSDKAKYIKDVSAAAVLVIAIGAVLVAVCIFVPYILAYY